MTQLVREAAGMQKQNLPRQSKCDASPRSVTSSSNESLPVGGGSSLTQSLRNLFSAGAYRQDAPPTGQPFQCEGAKLHEKWGDFDYDEDLQEDVYMERVFFPPPVQNTFIHYKTADEEDGSPQWRSSPAQLLLKSFHTKWPSHEEAHYQGRCRPCAYHLYKKDGCRLGDGCQFCHLCKRGEIKTRKKEKATTMRLAREARQRAAADLARNEEATPCTNGFVGENFFGESNPDLNESQARNESS